MLNSGHSTYMKHLKGNSQKWKLYVYGKHILAWAETHSKLFVIYSMQSYKCADIFYDFKYASMKTQQKYAWISDDCIDSIELSDGLWKRKLKNVYIDMIVYPSDSI